MIQVVFNSPVKVCDLNMLPRKMLQTQFRFFDLEDTFADVIMFPVRNSPGFHHSFINQNHHAPRVPVYLLSTRFTVIYIWNFFQASNKEIQDMEPTNEGLVQMTFLLKGLIFFEVPGCNFQTFSRVDGLPPVLLGTFKPQQQTLGSASEVFARNPRLQRPGIVWGSRFGVQSGVQVSKEE